MELEEFAQRGMAAQKAVDDLGAGTKYKPGDVFQINEKHGRAGWIGAFVMATKVKGWGLQGFVSHVESHDKQARAYIRLKWDEVDYIGHAPLIPEDEAGGAEDT